MRGKGLSDGHSISASIDQCIPPTWPASLAASEPFLKVPSGLRPEPSCSQSQHLKDFSLETATYLILNLHLVDPGQMMRVETADMTSVLGRGGALDESTIRVTARLVLMLGISLAVSVESSKMARFRGSVGTLQEGTVVVAARLVFVCGIRLAVSVEASEMACILSRSGAFGEGSVSVATRLVVLVLLVDFVVGVKTSNVACFLGG